MTRAPSPGKTPALLALEALLRATAWKKGLYPRLLAMAKPLAKDTRMGRDDLVQLGLVRAYRRTLRPEAPLWSADAPAPFYGFMRGAMKSERWKALMLEYAQNELLDARRPTGEDDDGPSEDERRGPNPEGNAEDLHRRNRRARRGDARVEAAMKELDAIAQDVFQAILNGTYDPEALAEKHGLEVEKIYAAQRRVVYRVDVVLDAIPDSSGPQPPLSPAPNAEGNQ